ncbi:hypothetical protein OHT57_45685 [Streptomyces sp. NBC_00285]|uniref:hypothetical protein n=1 Tax=Streptomyces sp. NBC_00285 TaxID=2975700 RepID=UPI002E2AD64C|nr:hypothetical protein [Streptomyces sp. NBC_00285]
MTARDACRPSSHWTRAAGGPPRAFAKPVLPGALVGHVVAGQRVGHGQRRVQGFAEQLSKIKSMIAVHTSPISQAVVVGALLEIHFSLERVTSQSRQVCQRSLAPVLNGLEALFGLQGGFKFRDWVDRPR